VNENIRSDNPLKKSSDGLYFADLDIRWHNEENGTQLFRIVKFRGKITDVNSYSLNQKFYKILENNSEPVIILDMSELSYINSIGLAILHSLIFKIQENKAKIAIGGLHPFLKRILSLIEAIPDMKVFDSCDEAKKSFPWQYHL